MPIRPLGLAADLLHAVPGEAVTADADAVADRPPTAQYVIEVGIGRIDDDGARGLLGREGHFLAAQVRRKLRRAHFRLLFRRQRRELHRPAVGTDGLLLRLRERAGGAWRLRVADRPRGAPGRGGLGWIDRRRTRK